jgi:hypothetical protein
VRPAIVVFKSITGPVDCFGHGLIRLISLREEGAVRRHGSQVGPTAAAARSRGGGGGGGGGGGPAQLDGQDTSWWK